MLLEVLGLVQKHARYSLTRIKRLFPNNSPQGGVATLVHLLVTVLEAADFLRTTFPSVFSSLLEARSFLEELDDEPMDCLLPKYLQVRGSLSQLAHERSICAFPDEQRGTRKKRKRALTRLEIV